MIKAFAESAVKVYVKVGDTTIAMFSTHPNLLILPQVGQKYVFRTTMENQKGISDQIAEIGVVREIQVFHTLNTRTRDSDGDFGSRANGQQESTNLEQTIKIICDPLPNPIINHI